MQQPEFPVRGSDTAHAFGWGVLVASSLIAAIFIGSRGLKDFDPALVSYAGASVFAGFGLGYRYSMWLRRPPTRMYWYRGWQLFLRPRQLPGNILHLGGIFLNNIVLQKLVVRLWLLTVSTEAPLSGQMKTLTPAAAGSLLLLLINACLLHYVYRFDHDVERESQE